jgi:hypothetical protein
MGEIKDVPPGVARFWRLDYKASDTIVRDRRQADLLQRLPAHD